MGGRLLILNDFFSRILGKFINQFMGLIFNGRTPAKT